jgi:hypothetical protein
MPKHTLRHITSSKTLAQFIPQGHHIYSKVVFQYRDYFLAQNEDCSSWLAWAIHGPVDYTENEAFTSHPSLAVLMALVDGGYKDHGQD